MPEIVLDSSVAMAWALGDERSVRTERAVKRAFDGLAHVPALWLYEVQNALAVAVRRRRLTVDDAREACENLASIPTRVHAPHGIGREFAVAMPSALSAYDAAYLCIAQDTLAPLATLDEPLREAAHSLGIALFD